jgi:hypothetical protein
VSAEKLEIEEIKSIPVLLGEKDILKTIQLLPGIQSAGEGGTGFYARGGILPDKNIPYDTILGGVHPYSLSRRCRRRLFR